MTLALAVLVTVAAVAGIARLQRYSDQYQQIRLSTIRLQGLARSLTHLQRQIEEGAGLSETMVQEGRYVRDAMITEMNALRALDSDQTAGELVRAFTPYEADLNEALRLSATGQPPEVQRGIDANAATHGAQLVAVAESVAEASASSAERASTLAVFGRVSILLLAIAAMVLLVRRGEQARRLAAVMAAERSVLSRSERRFRALVQHAGELIVILSADGLIQYVSPSSKLLLGGDPEEVIGQPIAGYVAPADQAALRSLLHDIAAPDQVGRTELRLGSDDHRWHQVEVTGRNLLEDPSVGGIVLNARDVTEQKALEAELTHRASHDTLTELPNRALLLDRLAQALARTSRTRRGVGVMFIDLDDFKDVNDTLGHDAGDQLLVTAAQRLQGAMRPGDTVARLGGDEFVVLLEDLANPRDAEEVARRSLARLGAPFLLEGHEVSIKASVGVATSGAEPVRPDELLRRADTAMYAAKAGGKGGYVLFDASPDRHPR